MKNIQELREKWNETAMSCALADAGLNEMALEWWLSKFTSRTEEVLAKIQMEKLRCPCGNRNCEHEAFDRGLEKARDIISGNQSK
jgi:hypothetical protein